MFRPAEIAKMADYARRICDTDVDDKIAQALEAYRALLEAQPAIEWVAVERFAGLLKSREDELQTIVETCVRTGDQGNAFAASERLREVEAMLAALKASEGAK